MKYTDLSCIKCGKRFDGDGPGTWEDSPPNGGLLFISHGNYGSRIYDEGVSSANYLTVAICDDCVLIETGKQNVMHCAPVRREYDSDVKEPWEGPGGDLAER